MKLFVARARVLASYVSHNKPNAHIAERHFINKLVIAFTFIHESFPIVTSTVLYKARIELGSN